MFASVAWRRSLFVYHLHMGGPNADALQVQDLLAPRPEARLRQMGVSMVESAPEADVLLVTGLLTVRNVDPVLAEIAALPAPAVIVAVGDNAMNGGVWAALDMPGLADYPLGHYADVQISVPGDPPEAGAILAALSAAATLLSRPGERPLTRTKTE